MIIFTVNKLFVLIIILKLSAIMSVVLIICCTVSFLAGNLTGGLSGVDVISASCQYELA